MTTARRTALTVDSPVGPITFVAADDAIVGLYMDEQAHRPELDAVDEPGNELLNRAAEQLRAYFARERQTFDLPLRFEGTAFQQRVWQALLEIPYGKTASYGELARDIGQPTASRAVGLANGRNPIAIIVPCHRVIGSSGKLVGYGGGMTRKQFLLDLERGTTPMV